MALKEQAVGWSYNPYSLIAHERLNVGAVSVTMWDWAHVLLCDGLLDNAVAMFFKTLQRSHARSSMYEYADFALKMTLPKHMSGLEYVLSQPKIFLNLKKIDFAGTASELLTQAPLLARYIRGVVLPREECVRHCENLLALFDILELITSLKAKLRVDPCRLLTMIESYLEGFKALYGESVLKFKHHAALHLPGVLARHGDLPSTLTNERRHKVVKRYTRDRLCGQNWELGSLEEVVCQQLHECKSDWYSHMLVDAHKPNARVLSALQNLWPWVTSFTVSARARCRHSQVTCGDFIWYDLTSLGVAGACLGSLVLLVNADGADVAILTYCEPFTHDAAWPAFTCKDELVVVSLECILCSTVSKRNEDKVSVHRPLFLR